MADLILNACYVLFALCVLMLIRNQLVYKASCKAIGIIYDTNVWMISNDIQRYESAPLRLEHFPSHDAMLFDMTKWTFAQFFPALANVDADGVARTPDGDLVLTQDNAEAK